MENTIIFWWLMTVKNEVLILRPDIVDKFLYGPSYRSSRGIMIVDQNRKDQQLVLIGV